MLKRLLFIVGLWGGISPLFLPAFGGGRGLVTGFPIPRFVSTRSDESNIRTGPGTNYPVRFILKVQAPLQITDEYKDWRQVIDWQGEQGWIHKTLLTGKQKVIVITPKANIHKGKTTDSPIIATTEKNYIFPITKCTSLWCEVKIDTPKIKGYILKENIWGNTD